VSKPQPQPSPFEHIIRDIREWPIYRLSRNRSKFIEEVTKEAFANLSARSNSNTLEEIIAKALYMEQTRIREDHWSIDPRDEKAFWANVKSRLLQAGNGEAKSAQREKLVREIIARYAHEIAGRFKPRTYGFAKKLVRFFFARLLNAPARRGGIRYLVTGKRVSIYDKITLTGPIDSIRSLAKTSTIVIIPTHFSNLDSVVMGWVIEAMGLPAFLYGAGLNLFNIRLLGYFMNRLGAYKVDRRKKNIIYLETLNAYSTLALHRGAHSLFFPGGTRSRSGSIEKKLKLGLLRTTIDAQRRNFSEGDGRKVIIVPAVISYHVVLEAPALIEQFLAATGKERYYSDTDRFSTSYKMARLILRVFAAPSDFTISFGRPMDVFGHSVDDEGQSLDAQGNPIDISRYFMLNGAFHEDTQRDAEYNKLLAQTILSEYYRSNVVLSSHLVAFTAFELFRKQHPRLDLFELLRLPPRECRLSYPLFAETVERLRNRILMIQDEGKVNVSPKMSESIEEVIRYGLRNLGIFHSKRPLLRSRTGDIITRDLKTLYYYRNRLDGYNLHEHV